MAMHNVLMIIGCYYPEIGGNEKICGKVAAGLVHKGCRVDILTEYRQGLPGQEIIDGLPVYRYIKGWHMYEYTYMLSVLSFLLRQCRSHDSIFCFGLYLFTAPTVLFCKAFGKKIFVLPTSSGTTGDIDRLSRLRTGNFVQWCSHMANRIIALSGAIHQELLENGFPPHKIIHIPNGVDTSFFSPLDQSKDSNQPFTVCYIGRLVKEKGVETLLEAIYLAQKKVHNIRAIIVGGGDLETKLKQRALELDLKDRTIFAGEVVDVLPYYRQADVFVLPSYSEGMPLAVLEAMACALPVIATPVGGITDIIQGSDTDLSRDTSYHIKQNGILVHPGDAKSIADAIVRLSHDKELYYRLSCEARTTVEKRYRLDMVIEEYFSLLKI